MTFTSVAPMDMIDDMFERCYVECKKVGMTMHTSDMYRMPTSKGKR